MLNNKENSSTNGVSGGWITQSKETQMFSDEIQANPGQFSPFSEKGIPLYNKIHGDHKLDENRLVERDFLQLPVNSSKREVEDDEIYVISKDNKKPKLETLNLSLALPDVSLSLAASNQLQFLNSEPSVKLNPSRSLQSFATNSNNTQTTFSTDFTAASMSFYPFSHNPSCSMTQNSSVNNENSKIYGGEGTNGSVHSRFRPVGDGGVVLVQSNRTNSDNNLSLFPSEIEKILVRIKEAEARMFQKKADEARKEAEEFKRMIIIKIDKLDEEYTDKLSKLCLNESEERKKQKVEEFKVLENSHCEYYKMKMRMQTEIAGLLQRMENTKIQWV